MYIYRRFPNTVSMFFTFIAIVTLSILPMTAGATAEYDLQILSLREGVSSIPELNVAVADATTPTPSYEGKDLLVMDGDYYQLLPENMREEMYDNIRSAALAGVPVAFVVPGYEKLYADLGVVCQSVAVREGDKFVELLVSLIVSQTLQCRIIVIFL